MVVADRHNGQAVEHHAAIELPAQQPGELVDGPATTEFLRFARHADGHVERHAEHAR